MHGGSPHRSAPGADRSGHVDAEPAGSSHRPSATLTLRAQPYAVSGCIAIQASDRVWWSECACQCDCARHQVPRISQPYPGDFFSVIAVICCGFFLSLLFLCSF